MILYGSKWPLWLHVAQDGSRMPQMAHEGYMASDCFVWLLIALMATHGSRLPLMAKDGYMASCGSVQPLLVQDGSRLPRWLNIAMMAPDGFIWLLNTIMAKYGSRLPQMAQYGSLWL